MINTPKFLNTQTFFYQTKFLIIALISTQGALWSIGLLRISTQDQIKKERRVSFFFMIVGLTHLGV